MLNWALKTKFKLVIQAPQVETALFCFVPSSHSKYRQKKNEWGTTETTVARAEWDEMVLLLWGIIGMGSFSWKNTHLIHGGYGQPPMVEYTTRWWAAFQSRPNHYTIFTANSNSRDLHIVCSSTSLISDILLITSEAVIEMKANSRGIQLLNDTLVSEILHNDKLRHSHFPCNIHWHFRLPLLSWEYLLVAPHLGVMFLKVRLFIFTVSRDVHLRKDNHT